MTPPPLLTPQPRPQIQIPTPEVRILTPEEIEKKKRESGF